MQGLRDRYPVVYPLKSVLSLREVIELYNSKMQRHISQHVARALFTKDLSLRIVKLQYTHEMNGFFHPSTRCESDAIQGPKAYSYTTTMSQG